MDTTEKLKDAVKRMEENPTPENVQKAMEALDDDDPAKERAARVEEAQRVRKLNAWRTKARKA